ncbi:MAG: hypothetical protein ACR2LT_07595 [Pyrinomonadaceae bacterium]
MRKSIILPAFIALSLVSFKAYGQTAAPTPSIQQQIENQRQIEAQRQEQQRQILIRQDEQRRFEALRRISESPRVRIKPISEIRSITPLSSAKLTDEQKMLLKPNDQDLIAYADFLKQPNTGLIKLFPDAGCQDNAEIVRADAECLGWIPNSSFYSFRRNKYINQSVADIRYKDGFFISDGLLAQGIMAALGDISLENVSLEKNNLRLLANYKPEPKARDAAEQSEKITAGIKIGDYTYRNIWQAVENTTYALRVIAYRGVYYVPFRGYPFNILDGDTRKDVIIVFRVVRKDTDGSVTLLWKELDRKDSPKIIVPKKNKDKKSSN